MRKLLCVVVALGLLAACARKPGSHDSRVHVVAAFYPLEELARRVGGNRVVVTNLTPVGVEPHDIEMTPSDIDALEDADVVLYIGGGFQPGVERVAQKQPRAVDVGRDLGDGHDPHIWLDPTLMQKATFVVRDALNSADPAYVQTFKENADVFAAELVALDARYRSSLAPCAGRQIVSAHAAFGYLAKRYDLVANSISGVSPEAEPSPARLAELERLVRDAGVTTVFYEELVPRDFADTLAKQAGIKTAVLNPLEGLTKSEEKRGEDYISVMGRNRAALANGLGCV